MIVAALTRLAAPRAGMTSFTNPDISARNMDSTPINGVEVGLAHVDLETDRVTAGCSGRL